MTGCALERYDASLEQLFPNDGIPSVGVFDKDSATTASCATDILQDGGDTRDASGTMAIGHGLTMCLNTRRTSPTRRSANSVSDKAMTIMTSHRHLASALILSCATLAGAAAPAGPITASIPGPDGGWDYANVDPETNRLFVAHGDAIGVVDLAQPTRVMELAKARHAHAVVPIPGRGEVLVTDGDAGTARFLDARTGAVRASVAVGVKPDAAIWDARRGRVVVMNAKSGTVITIDPASARVVSTVTMKPGLEFAAFDAKGRLYVNNEDSSTIGVIDADRGTLVATIALPGCDGPTGMAYAARADRIVSACGNGTAVVVDPATRRVVAKIAIGAAPDAVIADPVRGRLYIPAGGDGTLTVLADGKAGIRAIGRIATGPGARTGAVDPRSGLVYLPAATMAKPATTGGHGTAVPGTFHVLVVKAP